MSFFTCLLLASVWGGAFCSPLLAQSTVTSGDTSSGQTLSEINGDAAPTASEGIQPFDPAMIDENYFDDGFLMQGFADRYMDEDFETLLAMVQDETIPDIKAAAAVRAFREKYALDIFNRDKAAAERVLLKTYNRSGSAFLQVELMHTLVLMDRYKYYATFVPRLLLKMDHYNDAINQAAFKGMEDIISHGNNRSREARIVFNTLRKMLFLKKKRLANVTEPDERLKQKIGILKWSIKILGSQELDRLPKEVLNLL